MIDAATHAAVFLAALIGMEGVAWLTHRYVMHGPLWVLHKSHHEPHDGGFERNDLFGLGFAAIAVALFAYGTRPGWDIAWWAGCGMTAYGALYAMVHDSLVHRRWPGPLRPRGRYLRRLVQAHRLHHAVTTKAGAVSFGFLIPGDITRLRATLRENMRVAATTGPA